MDLVPLKKHSLTRAQFEQLADVPPEEEWLANITNLKTRRAYKEDVREFISFTALQDYMGLRSVGRSHIIAWRKDMERRDTQNCRPLQNSNRQESRYSQEPNSAVHRDAGQKTR